MSVHSIKAFVDWVAKTQGAEWAGAVTELATQYYAALPEAAKVPSPVRPGCTWTMAKGDRQGQPCGAPSKAGQSRALCTRHLVATETKEAKATPSPNGAVGGGLSSKTVVELRAMCKARGIKGYSNQKKDVLVGWLNQAASASPMVVAAPVVAVQFQPQGPQQFQPQGFQPPQPYQPQGPPVIRGLPDDAGSDVEESGAPNDTAVPACA
jgi:hypothetical protein